MKKGIINQQAAAKTPIGNTISNGSGDIPVKYTIVISIIIYKDNGKILIFKNVFPDQYLDEKLYAISGSTTEPSVSDT